MSVRASRTAAVISDAWPALPWAEWKHTYATLHMWTQIVGKVRLALYRWSITGGTWLCM